MDRRHVLHAFWTVMMKHEVSVNGYQSDVESLPSPNGRDFWKIDPIDAYLSKDGCRLAQLYAIVSSSVMAQSIP